ncbi:MAG: AI-2E family transporter [Planctomycetota bacterium]
MARITSLWALLGTTAVAVFLFYRVIAVLLLPLFLAVVLVLLLQPLYGRLLRSCGGRRYLAAALMTLAVLLAVLVPAAVALAMAGHEAVLVADQLRDGQLRQKLDRARLQAGLDYPFAEEWRFLSESLDLLSADAARGALAEGHPQALARVRDEFRLLAERIIEHQTADHQAVRTERADWAEVEQLLEVAAQAAPGTFAAQRALSDADAAFRRCRAAALGGPWMLTLRELANPSPAELRRWSAQAAVMTSDWLTAIGGATGAVMTRLVMGVVIFVFAVFFWFAEGPQIIRSLMLLSPLEEKYVTELLREFEVLVRAVVAGSLISAVVQALLAGLGYWLAGLDSVFLLIAATALMGMVPFVGATLVWIPAGLWMILGEGRFGAGLFLLCWGTLVVSTIDNLIRPWVLLEQASLHPLAALIGVLGGVQGLGPAGVFVGPLVVAFVQTLLMLLHRELAEVAP